MKNLKAIILLFLANSISGVAQGISMIAIPWYFAKENMMSGFGVIYVITSIISFLWVPYSGTLVDKYNRKYIFLTVSAVCGILLTAIAMLGDAKIGVNWMLVAAAFIMTFVNYNIHYPNLYAFIQEITEKKHYGKVTSYIEIIGQLTSVMAGAGAALLLEGTSEGLINIFGLKVNIGVNIEAWTIFEIFKLDAASYLLAFLIILLIRYQPVAKKGTIVGSVWSQLQTGWQYLKTHPSIFLFGVASYSIFVTVLITTFYLGATYVKNHLTASGDVYAASEMYFALGSVFAGAGIRWIFKSITLPMAIIVMTIVTTGLFAVLSITTSIAIFYGMCLLLGIMNAGTRIMRVTYLFTHVPNYLYGRASSIFFLTNISFRILFLGIFSLAFFHEGNNVIYTFAILSVFLFLTALILIRNYERFLNPEPE